jgi:VWFA-related protein
MSISSWAWVSLLSLSLPCIAQQAAPLAPSDARSATPAEAGRQINLDVVVADRSGKPVAGLTQQDFSVLDNKRPTNILSFHAFNAETPIPNPVKVILVVDQVNTSFDRVAYERDQVKKFLTLNGGKLADPTSLVFFSDTGTQIMDTPTRDGNALAAAVDSNQNSLRIIRRSQGFYGAQERFELSLKTLSSLTMVEAAKPGRKVIIWISPGWPMLSGPRIDLSSNDARGLFNELVRLSTALREAGITLYSVDPLGLADAGGTRTTYYQEFLKGVTGPSRVDMGNLALQVFATQSGGLVTYGSNSIVAGLSRSIADLGAYYRISIEAAPADKPSEYHSLEVKVPTPGVTVRTRTGYYAQR